MTIAASAPAPVSFGRRLKRFMSDNPLIPLLLLLCWPAAQAQPLLTLDRTPSRRAAWAPMDSTASTTRDAPPPTR